MKFTTTALTLAIASLAISAIIPVEMSQDSACGLPFSTNGDCDGPFLHPTDGAETVHSSYVNWAKREITDLESHRDKPDCGSPFSTDPHCNKARDVNSVATTLVNWAKKREVNNLESRLAGPDCRSPFSTNPRCNSPYQHEHHGPDVPKEK